jgi:hypothetical protein
LEDFFELHTNIRIYPSNVFTGRTAFSIGCKALLPLNI